MSLMRRRWVRHLALAAAVTAIMLVAAIGGPDAGALDRQSIVSAYLCLGLLCGTLLIGPWRAVAEGRVMSNYYLRRDIGIWAALIGMVHFLLANMLAMNYAYLGRYVTEAAAPSAEARRQLYGAGTIMGYVVAVLFLLLLGLSSDRVMRRVGLRWWKRLQRSSYVAFALTTLHGFAFQALESRPAVWVVVVAVVSATVLGGQAWGRAALRRSPRTSGTIRDTVHDG